MGTKKFRFVLLLLLLPATLGSWNPIVPVSRSIQTFQIYAGAKNVGFLTIAKTLAGDEMHLEVYSEIKARVVFSFHAVGRETYRFQNDTLMASEVFRTVNNRVQLDHRIAKHPRGYVLTGSGTEKKLTATGIRTNVTRLFIEEPAGIDTVFSDRFGEWVPLKHLGGHKYQIRFPNGLRNTFTYSDGICSSMESEGSFYKVRMVPEERSGAVRARVDPETNRGKSAKSSEPPFKSGK